MTRRFVRQGCATLAGFAALLLSVAFPRVARAGNMDPTPERLVVQPPGLPPGQTCQSVARDPGALVGAGLRPQDFPCRPDNQAFANLVSELGFAIAPSAFTPARTTGVGGFEMSVEASYTRVSSGRSYWQLGTRGQQDSGSKTQSIVNASPDSLIQVYALKVRKGLPFGFEVAGSFGFIANTELWVGGGDVRWAMLEGFRTGVLGYLPDISLGGGVRTVVGDSRFYLTTVGIDVKASKPIPIADSSQLIPSIGYQRLIIYGDSNVVDSTPNVDALRECGYAGADPASGSPICRNNLPNGQPNNVDFANTFTFQKVRVHRNRGLVSLHYRYEILWLGSQFSFDITDPKDENPFLVGNRQWTLSFEGGVFF